MARHSQDRGVSAFLEASFVPYCDDDRCSEEHNPHSEEFG